LHKSKLFIIYSNKVSKNKFIFYSQNMKKAVVWIILIFLPIITFASQTPPICNSTPQNLQHYFSNVMAILSKAKSNQQESKPSWLEGLWKKFMQSTLWNIKILTLFWTEWFFSNFFQSFFVIFSQDYIVRDWTQLINFKKVIANYFLESSKKLNIRWKNI